jgi:hypothetical protein
MFISAKSDQIIICESLKNRVFGDDPFELVASEISELPVSFALSNEDIVSIE